MDKAIIKASSYTVEIGDVLESTLPTLLDSPEYKNVQKFILVDENTVEHCVSKLITGIDALSEAEIIQIESGEENKTIETVVSVWQALSEMGTDRKAVVINLGGGVIGDMGGFISCTYKRGIRFINIPTTLLSQVDASVGGKLGIDLDNLKNQIGLISNPEAVYVDPSFLSTLPKEQLRSGYAEIIKHGLIRDKEHWNYIKQRNFDELEDYVEFLEPSINIKNDVVTVDPTEKGLRKILNFGHTIGHAIETYALSENETPKLFHGEAIAIGMICESFLSVRKGLLSESEHQEITDYLLKNYPSWPLTTDLYPSLLHLMLNDKKNENGQIKFSLLEGIGNCTFNIDCTKEDIVAALDHYLSLKH